MVRRSSRLRLGIEPGLFQPGREGLCRSNSAHRSARWRLRAPRRIGAPPSTSCSASIRMDLPAPVSPVSTVKPACRSSSSVCTMTKSRRRCV
jgi:hypothetical protein